MALPEQRTPTRIVNRSCKGESTGLHGHASEPCSRLHRSAGRDFAHRALAAPAITARDLGCLMDMSDESSGPGSGLELQRRGLAPVLPSRLIGYSLPATSRPIPWSAVWPAWGVPAAT